MKLIATHVELPKLDRHGEQTYVVYVSSARGRYRYRVVVEYQWKGAFNPWSFVPRKADGSEIPRSAMGLRDYICDVAQTAILRPGKCPACKRGHE